MFRGATATQIRPVTPRTPATTRDQIIQLSPCAWYTCPSAISPEITCGFTHCQTELSRRSVSVSLERTVDDADTCHNHEEYTERAEPITLPRFYRGMAMTSATRTTRTATTNCGHWATALWACCRLRRYLVSTLRAFGKGHVAHSKSGGYTLCDCASTDRPRQNATQSAIRPQSSGESIPIFLKSLALSIARN